MSFNQAFITEADGFLFKREAKFFKLHGHGKTMVWKRKATGEVTLRRDGSTGRMLLRVVRGRTAKLCADLMLSAEMLFRSENPDDPDSKRSWLWKWVDSDGVQNTCALRFTSGADSDFFISVLKDYTSPREPPLRLSVNLLPQPIHNQTSFGLTPISAEYRGPFRPGGSSPGPADVSDEDILQAYHAVRSDQDPTDWLLLNYTHDYSNKIVLSATGSGGLEDLLGRLENSKVSYAYLRLVYTKDFIRHTKFAFIRWVGNACAIDQLIKASDATYVREVFRALSFDIEVKDVHSVREKINLLMNNK